MATEALQNMRRSLPLRDPQLLEHLEAKTDAELETAFDEIVHDQDSGRGRIELLNGIDDNGEEQQDGNDGDDDDDDDDEVVDEEMGLSLIHI